MDLVRQEDRPRGRPLLTRQLQPQLGVSVGGRSVPPQPVQHLLASEGTRGETEYPVKLLLQLQPLLLSRGEVGEEGLDVDVTSDLPLLR